jgi:hypothetical protein
MGDGAMAPLFYDIGGEWSALHLNHFNSGKSSERRTGWASGHFEKEKHPHSLFIYGLFNDALNIQTL